MAKTTPPQDIVRASFAPTQLACQAALSFSTESPTCFSHIPTHRSRPTPMPTQTLAHTENQPANTPVPPTPTAGPNEQHTDNPPTETSTNTPTPSSEESTQTTTPARQSESEKDPKACIQVVVTACRPGNRGDGDKAEQTTCQDFATPCDVPNGWVIRTPADTR